jgi:hypothetical protein
VRKVGTAYEGYKDESEQDAVFLAVLIDAHGQRVRLGPWDRKRTARAQVTAEKNARQRAIEAWDRQQARMGAPAWPVERPVPWVDGWVEKADNWERI